MTLRQDLSSDYRVSSLAIVLNQQQMMTRIATGGSFHYRFSVDLLPLQRIFFDHNVHTRSKGIGNILRGNK